MADTFKRRGKWGKLPNKVALNKELSDRALVLLAYRTTIADQRKTYTPNKRELGALCRDGFGKNVQAEARRDAKAIGYLRRTQKSEGPGKFGFAEEKSTLPALAPKSHAYKVVQGDWFDGSLSRKELACFLFVNAKGGHVYAHEIEERFGWSRPTVARVLSGMTDEETGATIGGLIPLGRLFKQVSRNAAGRVESVTYSAKPATVKKQDNGYQGNGYQGDGFSGNTRSSSSNSLHGAPSEQYPHEAPMVQYPHVARAKYASHGEAPDLRSFDELWEQANQAANLLGWMSAEDGALYETFDTSLHEHLSAVVAIADDGKLCELLRRATQRRASGVLFSEAGRYSVRMLACWLLAESADLTPARALAEVLTAIWQRIGARRSGHLNSLAVIGKRMAGWLRGRF